MVTTVNAETIDPLSCSDQALMEKYDLPLGPFENIPCVPGVSENILQDLEPDFLEKTIEGLKKNLPLHKRIELDPKEWT